MTYNVFSGTLNPTHSLTHADKPVCRLPVRRDISLTGQFAEISPKTRPGPEKPSPIGLKCGTDQPGSTGLSRAGPHFTFSPTVTGQTGQFTREARPMSVFCILAYSQPSFADVLATISITGFHSQNSKKTHHQFS